MADNGTFGVDTEGLAKAAPQVHQMAGHIANLVNELAGQLAALGEPWGNDRAGQTFLSHYRTPASGVIDSVRSSGLALGSAVDGIQTMAKQYDRLEQQNVLAVQQFMADHPGVVLSTGGDGGQGGGQGSGQGGQKGGTGDSGTSLSPTVSDGGLVPSVPGVAPVGGGGSGTAALSPEIVERHPGVPGVAPGKGGGGPSTLLKQGGGKSDAAPLSPTVSDGGLVPSVPGVAPVGGGGSGTAALSPEIVERHPGVPGVAPGDGGGGPSTLLQQGDTSGSGAQPPLSAEVVRGTPEIPAVPAEPAVPGGPLAPHEGDPQTLVVPASGTGSTPLTPEIRRSLPDIPSA